MRQVLYAIVCFLMLSCSQETKKQLDTVYRYYSEDGKEITDTDFIKKLNDHRKWEIKILSKQKVPFCGEILNSVTYEYRRVGDTEWSRCGENISNKKYNELEVGKTYVMDSGIIGYID